MRIPCPDGCGLEVETLDYHEVEKLKKSHAAILIIAKDFGDYLNENYDEDNVPLMEKVNKAIAEAEKP